MLFQDIEMVFNSNLANWTISDPHPVSNIRLTTRRKHTEQPLAVCPAENVFHHLSGILKGTRSHVD